MRATCDPSRLPFIGDRLDEAFRQHAEFVRDTQKTLHELFDDQPEHVRHRITQGGFLELFPHVGTPPLEGVE
jgi:hypothetical protein